jgi:hypothetical protein
MAIYHFSIKNIGRSNGRSAVAAAAYRSGEKLVDSVYGKEQDYTKKTGIEYKNIYVPSHANENLLDRQTLWNEVEKSELKKNGDLKLTARLAKEFEIAFPHEVDADTRKRMLDELAQTIVKNHNVIVDAVIHAPHTKSGSDERNYHAHIMFTTRSINEQGELGKKAREFNDDGKNLTLAYRELWANMVNRELEQIGTQERVSHLSYSDLKYDLEPTMHEGSKVTQLRRQGIDTEISLKNDAIKARNAEKLVNEQLIKNLDQEIVFNYETLARLEIERKEAKAKPIEPQQPQTKKATETDARNAITKYKTAIDEIANQIFVEQQAKQIEDARTWLAKIEEMRANTPIFFGKKDHLAKIEQEVAQYEKMRSNFAKFKETGVTDEHRAAAIALIEKTKPNMVLNAKNSEKFLKNQKLEQVKKEIDPNISMLAEAHKAYTGKILRTDSNGTIQQTQNGLVYHPQIKDLKTGKEYTLTYTENQVKILENIEISRKLGKSQDNEIKR